MPPPPPEDLPDSEEQVTESENAEVEGKEGEAEVGGREGTETEVPNDVENEVEEEEEEEPGMWEESFKSHHDSKPYGAL